MKCQGFVRKQEEHDNILAIISGNEYDVPTIVRFIKSRLKEKGKNFISVSVRLLLKDEDGK